MKTISWFVIGVLLLALAGGGYFYHKSTSTAKVNQVSQFNVTPEKMARDLEGRQVALLFGQVWPFDNGQTIEVTVLSKKQIDDYVVVSAELKAVAKVQLPVKKDDPKVKEPKLPNRVAVIGLMKLTYERIGNDWYMINAEGVSLKATPVD